MADLTARFRAFIAGEQLFNRSHRLLVAVSGGVDSVVLAHLCHAEGYDLILAHCNFQLRGEESVRDEQFTVELASRMGCPIEVKRFDTEAYAAAHKLSVQESARALRYAWFRELAAEKGASRILTAHHADDNVETVLMNLFKGTGMTGLRGIMPLAHGLARPLLFASRADIDAYAREHQLPFVEDSSNLTDKYSRNYLRHHLLPLVENIIPGAGENLRQNMPRFREVESLYREAVNRKLARLMVRKGEEWHIPVEKLRLTKPLATILFEIFSGFGFSPAQLEGIARLMDAETGRFMQSASHRLLKNRNWFILSPLQALSGSIYVVQEGDPELTYDGGKLSFRMVDKPDIFAGDDSNIALLDASAIDYPLVVRRWKEGDYFYPLGMPRKKKIARFLIDRKLNRLDKERVFVVASGGRILWVIGQRIDDRARIKPSTRLVLRIEQKID